MPEFEIPSGNEYADQEMDYESWLSFLEEVLITEVDENLWGSNQFNGMKADTDVKGTENSYTTEFRQYTPWLGRWFSIDSLIIKYSHMPNKVFNNNPIYSDSTGLKEEPAVTEENVVLLPEVTVTASKPRPFIGSIGEIGTGQDAQSGINEIPESNLLRSKVREFTFAKDESLFGFLRTRLYETSLGSPEVAKMINKWENEMPEWNTDTRDIVDVMMKEKQIQTLIADVTADFQAGMIANNGQYTKIRITDLDKPNFGPSGNPMLFTLVGGIQKVNVKVTDIQRGVNNTYKATLQITLYDVFGVDEDDVIKYHDMSMKGIPKQIMGRAMFTPLAVFWVLQHQRGYTPMKNVYKIPVEINDSF